MTVTGGEAGPPRQPLGHRHRHRRTRLGDRLRRLAAVGRGPDSTDQDEEADDAADDRQHLAAQRPGLPASPGPVAPRRLGRLGLLAIRRLSLLVGLLRLSLVAGIAGGRRILRARH